LHKSGRMLIVIYDNNMFRLWNLLDGRCIFKRKLGLDPETNKVVHKAIQCKWEPTNGLNYAILYEKKLEVFTADQELPVSSVTSDTNFNCMEFVSDTEIVTADVSGKLTFVKNIQQEDKTTITLINTKVTRFRDIKCHPGSSTLVTASTEGKLGFYDVDTLRKFHLEIGNAKPFKSIKSKSRFLCLSINHLKPPEAKLPKSKSIGKKKKQIKKKLTKDEKILLKR
jgi:WD40 repeat protein